MFKLPNWMRPYAGSVIGSAVTIGLTQIAAHVPIVGGFITTDTANHVSEIILGYLFAHTATTVSNATVNPTQAATSNLAASVPAAVRPKSETPTPVSK